MNTSKATRHDDPRIVAAAERRMHEFEMNRELQDRASCTRHTALQAQCGTCYLTISRETGAGGSRVAELVGKKLQWEVFDKELLDCVSDQSQLPRPMLELVDETRGNWLYDVLGAWMDRQIVPQDKYVANLSRAVLAIARRGHAVFVGRGVQFLLPHELTLAVRLIAPEKYRVRQIMELKQLDADQARRYVAETDTGRRDFVERFFHRNIADPHLYHLTINVEHFGLEGAAEFILMAIARS